MARQESGWVKLHRQITETDIGHHFLLLGLWTTLMKWANYKDGRVKWRGLPRILERGEILTSATELAKHGGTDRKTVSKWLAYLERRQSISIEKAPKGSLEGMIIKIINYNKYNTLDAERSHEAGHEGGHEHGHEHGHIYKNSIIKEEKKPVVSASQKFQERFNPDNKPFSDKIEELDLRDPKLENNVFLIRERFKTIENFNEWIVGVSESSGFKSKETEFGRKNYLIAAMIAQTGLGNK